MEGVDGGVAISIRGLTHRYPSPDGTLDVLCDVDLDVPGGGYVAVTGPSGAGKSTLLSVLGGLESLQEGAAAIGDVDHRPLQLSGGERQRVAIARAVSNRPRLLLADEPTGNLDEDSATTVIELLEQLRTERGCTLLVVTPHRAIAARASLRVALDQCRRAS